MAVPVAVKRQRLDELSHDDSSELLGWLEHSPGPDTGDDHWPAMSPGSLEDGDGSPVVPAAAAPSSADGFCVEPQTATVPPVEATPQQLLDAYAGQLVLAKTTAMPGPIASMGRAPAPVSSHELDIWIGSLPPSYALTTTAAERELHVRMMKQLLSEKLSPPVVTSWVPSKDKSGRPLLRLHIVFHDQCVLRAR